jgi:electron-transferring-flavoprotein dehydrogenase
MAEIEREAMDVDVVIVGAGPAGLSAAIRLKQLNEDLMVVVLEKGSEVGAHILSGAVLDPSGLDALIPDWKEKGAPVTVPVKKDNFYIFGEGGQMRIPNWVMPPLMNNHGNYIVSMGNVCRWLAEQAEALGVEVYPGMACSELVYDENGAVKGVVAGEFGRNADGTPGEGYEPGMELHGKYTIISEGVRGSLAKEIIAKYDLGKNSDVPKFGIGLKEIWDVDPENHNEGEVTHSLGWPLGFKNGGGSFLYHIDNNQVYVGYIVDLNYKNPYLNPYQEFQRFKHHPRVKQVLEGGKRVAYGARAVTKGGFQSIPDTAFPGGVIAGCSAGLVNLPRIKGNHNAMHSGRQAAEAAYAAIEAGRSGDTLTEYDEALKSGPVGKAQARAQRRASQRPLRPRRRHGAGWLRHVVPDALRRLLAVRNAQARQVRSQGDREGLQAQADRLSQARRRSVLRPADQRELRQHEPRGKPALPPQAQGRFDPDRRQPARVCRARSALLPGRCLRGGRGRQRPEVPDQFPELRPLQDLRHQGPVPEHQLDGPAGRRRAELSQHVTFASVGRPARPTRIEPPRTQG